MMNFKKRFRYLDKQSCLAIIKVDKVIYSECLKSLLEHHSTLIDLDLSLFSTFLCSTSLLSIFYSEDTSSGPKFISYLIIFPA